MSAADLTSSADYTAAPFPQPAKLSRRMRPPDLDIKANMDNRATRSDKFPKSARRESRLAFGRFFGRHKVVTDAENTSVTRDGQHDSNDSEVMSETIGGTPYNLQPQGLRSEVRFGPIKDIDTLSRPRTAGLRSPTFAPPLSSPTMATNGKRRGSLATSAWSPLPLFQAWPQAVRTATLPACLQADTLLRLHNKKEMLATISHPDTGDEKDVFVNMAKKRHRRNSSSFKLDWTTKIYILVASGYLLQYAGDGAHDCLPEKVVQLTKDSAAFASDVIPGRHWVLQVSSVFEDGALTSHDTRSLLGKFGLREKERRHASDMLMIFENAADMDSWMSLLRREIEGLGGRVPMTEMGTPRQGDDQPLVVSSPTSPAGRAPVLREPSFGRIGSMPDLRWDASITIESPELHLDAALTELMPDHTFDDNSASNSFVSHDGRQLDGLRDSNNRYSFMSVARTIITSDSSACNSPIRDSFGSGSQGSHPSEESTPLADELDDVQLRPNAADIENRRQSYRTSNFFLDCNRQQSTHRQHSSLSLVQEPPNFSLPHPAARRRAASQTASEVVHIAHAAAAPVRPPRRPRRPPPPTLGFTRPLSIVADSPSPSRLSPSNPMDKNGGLHIPPPLDSPSIFNGWASGDNKLGHDFSRVPSRQSNMAPLQVSIHKYASMNSLRPADHSLWDDPPSQLHSPLREPPLSANDIISQGINSLESPGLQSPTRSRSPIQRAMAAQKRASMYSLSSTPRRGSVPVFTNNINNSSSNHRPTQSDHRDVETYTSLFKASRLSIPGHACSGSAASCLTNRRSMPQLPQAALPVGPPPAPPPNKALPPIPVGKKMRSGIIPAQRRVPSVAALPGGEF